jgi:hypothetical protein
MSRISSQLRSHACGLAIAAGAVALLGYNTVRRTEQVDYRGLFAYRRLWSDLALGTSRWLGDRLAPAPAAPEGRRLAIVTFRQALLERIAARGLTPWRFWRTIPARAFLVNARRIGTADFDDPGRAWLLSLGFRGLGGMAPYLILWLGAIFAAPILVWTVLELGAAGFRIGAVVFAVWVVSSPFVVETLALTRYAVGFYLLAVLALVPLAVYAAGAPRPTLGGLFLRVLAAGSMLGLAGMCRSSALLTLPGYAAALAIGCWRISGARRLRALALTLLLAVPLLTPFLLLREPQRHDVWQPLWEGLGDFDRTKGHVWADSAALERVRREGVGALWTPESEAILRREVLAHVREDPGWFAGILARRFVWTLTLRKLWPSEASDGRPMEPIASVNEGGMDRYWRYTTSVDYLSLGYAQVELPIVLLVAPALVLVLLALLRRGPAEELRRRRSALLAIGCVALGGLTLPVVISTVGGQETQSFALTFILAIGLLPELVAGSLSRPAP